MRRILCGRRIFGRLLLTAASLAAAVVAHDAAAQPTAPAVVSGQATVSTPKPGTTIVQQSTEKAILNWPSLSVPSGNLLQFEQPNSAAITLNRVLSGVTAIDGSLIANGRVWIINPNGVLFGSNASVNVAGLIATTSDITNQDFASGNYNFGLASTNPNAAIVNAGAITAADGGAVVLSGPRVANKGVIAARLGTVALGAGNAFTVDFQGDKLLSFAVTAPVTQTPTDKQGKPASALVSNSGTINAAGGTVLLTARAARDVLDNVVNTTGMISATTAHDDNGTIVLDAGPDGTASVDGQLDASGKAAGATGGTVEVLGGTVAVNAGATIDASGDRGGGTVLIGGNLHGAGPQPTATNTVVAPGASIDADAITSGNGGTVAVWANDHTVFDGTISVRGGAQGGNGGLVETSGQQALSVTTGTVDALAPKGQVGTWLLDPTNITVATGGTDTVADADNSEFYFLQGTADFDIDPSAIASAQANVNLTASNNITFANSIAMANPGVGITAVAGNSITVDPGASITTQGGAILFKSNLTVNDIILPSGDGGIAIAAPLSTAGGGQTGGSVALIVSSGTGTIALAQNITTAGGSISLTGPTVVTAQATLDTTNGGLFGAGAAVTLTGTLEGPQGLALDAGGNSITLATAVGDQTPLASLKVTAAAITFTDPVTVTGALDTTGSGLTTFDSTVTAGSVATGAAALDGGLITTTSGQSYGAATLAAPTTLVDTGASVITVGTLAGTYPLTITDAGGAITLAGTANGMPPLADLTATGATVAFNGALAVAGAVNTLAANLTTFDGAVTAGSVATGAVAIDGGSVTTVAGQSYGAATLGGNTTLTDTSGSAITFAGALDGSQTLTIDDAGGAVTFAGAIGSKVAAASLDTTATGLTIFDAPVMAASVATGAVALDAGSITTSAGQRYGTLTLAGNTVLTDTGASPITLGAVEGEHTLTITDAGGAITLAGAAGTPALPLSSLSATGATIAFDGSLDVATTVQTTSVGLTTFAGPVTAGSVATGAVMFDGPVITTVAGQSYGAAMLGAPTTLTDTGASPITLGGTLSGNNALTINDAGGAITLTGTVNGTPPLASLTATGATAAFDGALGVAGAVNTLGVGITTFDGVLTAGSVTTGAVAFAGGSITTAGGQSYGPAMLDRNITLADNAGGPIAFTSTLNGANALTLSDAGGAVTFTGAVGNQVPLASLTAMAASVAFDNTAALTGALDTAAVGQTTFDNAVTAARVTTGAIALDGGSVTTSAGQTYSGLATIGADTVLSDTGTSAILFANRVGGTRSLTIADAGGAVTFQTGLGDQVTGLPMNLTVASATLNLDDPVLLTGSLDASAVGLTTFAGTGVTTAGSQSYGAATIASNVGLAVSGGGTITINGAVDAAEASAFSLGLSSNGGAMTLNGPVGTTAAPLMSLSASGGAVTFAAPIRVAGALDTSAATLTTFAGTVTADSVATAAVALDGGAITTTWKQSYGAATLGADATLTNTGSGAIVFAGPVDGAHALTVDNFGSAFAPAAIDFAGAIGARTPLTSLTASVASGGTLTLGASVTTTGAQTYTASTLALGGSFYGTSGGNFLETGATQLTNTAAIDTTGQGAVAGGNIAFSGQVSGGSNTLSLAAGSGAITLAGVTAANLQLASAALTLDSGTYSFGSPTTVVPAATVNGELTLNQATQFGAVTLGGATTLDSASNIVFTAPVVGGTNSLTINGRNGTVSFAGITSGALVLNDAVPILTTGAYDIGVGPYVFLAAEASGTLTFGQPTSFDSLTVLGATSFDTSSVNGALSFGLISDGQIGGSLTPLVINAGAGTVTLSGSIVALNGPSSPGFGAVTVTGGTIALGADISTNGGSVTLTGATILPQQQGINIDTTALGAAPSGANIVFAGAGTIDGAASLALDAGTSGTIAVGGAVGSGTKLAGLTASGAAIVFNGPVALTGGLDTSATGLTTFAGAVTAASVRTDAVLFNGGSVTTTSGQSYGAAPLVASNPPGTGSGSDSGTGSGDSDDLDDGVVFTTVAPTLGSFTLAQDVTQSSVSVGGGAATLGTNMVLSDNGGAITFGGTLNGPHSLTINDAGGSVTLSGAVGGLAPLTGLTAASSTIAFGGPVSIAGALDTAAVGLTSFAGNVVAARVSTGSATIAGGSVVTSGSQIYAGGIDISADTTLAAGSDVTLGGTSLFNNAFALDVLAGGNVTVAGAVQNAGTGPITVVAGWDGVTPAAQAASTPGAFGRNGGSVVIGGADASGNAGLGSAGGTTTVAAADLGVQAVNGFAQLGYAGAGTSGAIDVTLTGSLALNGGPTAGAYAQIGHGGEGIGGSESGDIAVTAAGNVTLAGGSGSLAYAQIGHGGAFSNEHATAAFSDTGAITVAGDAVTLAGGSGSGAYAQIGHGGIGSAQDAAIAAGSIAYTGTITVAASGAMSLAGDGPEAYAQIGNGGYQSLDGTNLAEGTGITELGDITVTTGTASSGGALQVMGDAYAQIGNGGYAANLGTNAPAAINEFGDIDVTVNGSAGTALVAAGDTGSFAYAQIGNGDAATVGVGNVGGNIAITVANPVDLRSGTSANAGIWNATGLGTVTGTTSVNGVIVAAPDNAISPTPSGPSLPPSALIAPWLTNVTFGLAAETFGSLTNDLSSDTLGSSLNAIAPSSGDQGGKGPIETMTDSKGAAGGGIGGNGSNGSALPGGNGGGNGGALPGAAQEADDLSSGIARTLSGTPGSVAHVVPQTILIGGLLTEAASPLSPRDTPQAVEPADQVYSSWGNEALWDWQ